MTRSEENARVVGRMLRRSMIEGDIDAALTAYAPGFTYHNPVLKALPPTQDARDAMRRLIEQTRDAFPNLDYVVEAMVADDDMVAVLYSWSAVDRHGFAGRPPSGRTVTATGAIFCRLADGKIVEQWDIDDRLDVAQQLGLLPEVAPSGSGHHGSLLRPD